MGLRVEGMGCRIWGAGFRVQGLESKAHLVMSGALVRSVTVMVLRWHGSSVLCAAEMALSNCTSGRVVLPEDTVGAICPAWCRVEGLGFGV